MKIVDSDIKYESFLHIFPQVGFEHGALYSKQFMVNFHLSNNVFWKLQRSILFLNHACNTSSRVRQPRREKWRSKQMGTMALLKYIDS